MSALPPILLALSALCECGQIAHLARGRGGRLLGAPLSCDAVKDVGRGLGCALPLASPLVHSAGGSFCMLPTDYD